METSLFKHTTLPTEDGMGWIRQREVAHMAVKFPMGILPFTCRYDLELFGCKSIFQSSRWYAATRVALSQARTLLTGYNIR